MLATYNEYIKLQLQTIASPLEREMTLKMQELAQNSHLQEGPRLYSNHQIKTILAECDDLIAAVPASRPYWTPTLREKFASFLASLPVDAYPTPEMVYQLGKRREYRQHVERVTDFINRPDAVILDIAGCTGWVSTVLGHLGYPKAVTVELNPINIIGGKYVWGHRSIIQGDAHQLRNCRHAELNFQKGGVADIIFSRYALEHFRDLPRVFSEFNYALKPGGKIFLIVGRGVKKKREDGDVHAFPDVASIYRNANDFCLIHYTLLKNAETRYYEHFVVLEKPADPALHTHYEISRMAQMQNRIGRIALRFKDLWAKPQIQSSF